jgi:hypothetical protein
LQTSVLSMLLCLAQLFSGSSEYVQQAERTSCLSYDQYSNEVWQFKPPHDLLSAVKWTAEQQ